MSSVGEEVPPALRERIVAPLHGYHTSGRLYLGAPNAKRALVFVHGFAGSPGRTWDNFLDYLEEACDISAADVYAYGYESVFRRAYPSALLFLDFMKCLLSRPDEYVRTITGTSNSREGGWQYNEVVIVAHSLGAVVARLALVEAIRSGEALRNTRLVLLAPAHMGSIVPSLALQALGQLGLSFLAPLAQYCSPLLDDLRENSSILAHLRDESRRLGAEEVNRRNLAADAVAIAESDRVVVQTPFPGDPTSLLIRGHNHIDITMPHDGSDDVLSVLSCRFPSK